MRRLLPRSLQGRLVLLVLGLVVLLWAGTVAVTFRDTRRELAELLDAHLAQAATLLVAQQVRVIEDDDDDERRARDERKQRRETRAEGQERRRRHHDHDEERFGALSLKHYSPRVVFQIWHEGRLVQRSANAPEQRLDRFGTDGRPGRERDGGFGTVRIDGEPWRLFSARGSDRDVQVFVAEHLGSRRAILHALLLGTLWPLLLGLPLLALGIWWAVRAGTTPLRRLGRTLAAREPQTLAPVDVADAPSEMQPMIDELNSLFGRIARMLETERRFTADAAHELRTPIAAIRTQAQVALAEGDGERRRHALQATIEGCDRAVRLVEQLLTLARLDAGGAAPTMAPVALAAVARRSAAALAPQALARGQTLELEADDEIRLEGVEALLAVLLRNLLDNALRYSPAGARVHATLQRHGSTVVLTVEDSGAGMADADIARLGERFFRVLGQDASGSGLGWSIVRRIAALHHAQVDVTRSAALGGLAVRVIWPA
ncbi:two-component sensor histidine kinase [Rubrivivax gelatinosus]|uniref:ATP-binding protein n=1 Tax=Rubrivivax gelatinosus TaxID=28068 RepID=UPI001907BBBE|nr:two-component sensor histidine kinase [Rubrivivax gelatinosus]